MEVEGDRDGDGHMDGGEGGKLPKPRIDVHGELQRGTCQGGSCGKGHELSNKILNFFSALLVTPGTF
eukprot:3934681-Rhodomonas_salina.1